MGAPTLACFATWSLDITAKAQGEQRGRQPARGSQSQKEVVSLNASLRALSFLQSTTFEFTYLPADLLPRPISGVGRFSFSTVITKSTWIKCSGRTVLFWEKQFNTLRTDQVMKWHPFWPYKDKKSFKLVNKDWTDVSGDSNPMGLRGWDDRETGDAPIKISACHVGVGTATSTRIMLPASVVKVVAGPWLLHQRIFFSLEDRSGGNVCR